MLRKIRVIAAAFCLILITLLFLDFTGSVHHWLGWLAKVQFMPALLAANVAVVGSLVLLTLLFGRIYCSVLCPLGAFQDAVSWLGGKWKKNRFRYSPALHVLRYGVLLVFVALIIAGIGSVVALLEPYSAFGRMAANLVVPFYQWGNNLLASFAERFDSYAFYSVDVWLKSSFTLGLAVLTFVVLAVLAWRNGRTYCNTICPVGTLLGTLSRVSLLKPRINASKCTHCGLCSRNCKASCIDSKSGSIDYSRCVTCFDCMQSCKQGALRYTLPQKSANRDADKTQAVEVLTENGSTRRQFLSISTLFAVGVASKVHAKTFDGGLALIQDKKAPKRSTALVPPGALGIQNFTSHCTACQLCVSVCPNQVLHPSSELSSLMQPEMGYERGYCRPECTRCSEVCPAGAIHAITAVEKSAIQIGHAVWHQDLCIVNTDHVNCNNCERHCPTGAIQMIALEPDNPFSLKIPMVDESRCIGCGACENLCPARPYSAIHVEGHERHKVI